MSATLVPFAVTVARALGTLAVTLALGACVGNVGRPVSESARDTEGRHDGVWIAKVDARGGRQNIERWQFDCPPVKFDWRFEVRDGVARIDLTDRGETRIHEGFVGLSGRFRLEMPLDRSARAKGGSDSRMGDGAVTLILEGDLDDEKPRGYYVVGIRQFLDRGCRQYVAYEKLSD